jgi:hypothetical protein
MDLPNGFSSFNVFEKLEKIFATDGAPMNTDQSKKNGMQITRGRASSFFLLSV